MARVRRSTPHSERATVTTAGTNLLSFEVKREIWLKQVEAYNETTASRVSVYVEASQEGGVRICGLTSGLSACYWVGDLKLQPPEMLYCSFSQCVVGDKLNFHIIYELEDNV